MAPGHNRDADRPRGTAQPQLEVHIRAALRVGSSRDAVVEVIQQMAVYAGFPEALNGMAALLRVLGESAASSKPAP
jgi:4-carboxymuconolactone decarboxylase